VTDARGAKTVYGYLGTKRRLVTSLGYDLSGVSAGQDVAAAPGVTFTYDATGRRKTMSDGLGVETYSFDDLGRLISEKRTLSDPDNDQVNGLEREITYGYNLAGELKFVRDPFGSQVDYKYDPAGRMTDVKTDTPYGGVSTYASNIQYRAWGALKGLSYGNSKTLSLGYNARMQVESYSIPGVLSNQYTYTTTPTSGDNDGLVKFVRDLAQTNSPFDRAYRYDHVGRLTDALTGSEARGGINGDGPYRDTYVYDIWGQSTSVMRRAWDTEVAAELPINGPTGRTSAWTYDADGRVTADDEGQTYRYDAAGRLVTTTYKVTVGRVTQTRTRRRGYDGDGAAVKINYFGGMGYRLMSSPLGKGELTMLDSAGQKLSTRVYAAGGLLAVQSNGAVRWRHRTPFDTTERETDALGVEVSRAELNPAGADFGAQRPPDSGGGAGWDDLVTPMFGDPLAPSNYMLDGVPMPSLMAGMFLSSLQAKGSSTGRPTGGVLTVVDNVWVDKWEDSTDNREYSFEYEGQTYTDKGASVSTDRGFFRDGAALFFDVLLRTSVRAQGPVQPPPDAVGIHKEFERMLNDPRHDCAAFIKKLLDLVNKDGDNSLVEGGDILKIFDKINSPDQKGMIRSGASGSYTDPEGRNGSYALGTIASHTAMIQLGPQYPGPPTAAGDALQALHETTHHAGQHVYTDKMLAQALEQWTGKPIVGPHGERPTGDDAKDKWIYSNYWGGELGNHCK
jgi:YD repeat-containing protein